MAGIWPYADGEVHYIKDSSCLFLSQKPYLPQGSLRLAASYPSVPETEGKTEMYFKLLGLEHLIAHLDEVDTWNHILSLGEQQRVAIVRALLNKPDILFLDEASSAMDEKSEALVYDVLKQELKDTVIVSVGHRSTLINKHDRVLTYTKNSSFELQNSSEAVAQSF